MPDYIVISNLVRPEKVSKHREDHRAYLNGLHEKGRIPYGARFKDGMGGMYLLTANSLGEADELARKDPYHFNGVREYTIREVERRYLGV